LTPYRKNILVLSCEHGGNEVPPEYTALFLGQEALLDSHRGWDPGALELGQQMAKACSVPLHAATTTRLLVELNRSIAHRQLFSAVTRPLASTLRRHIVDTHYRPHRDAIEGAVAAHIDAGYRVLHIASHSFTPVLDSEARRADVAWLYDPARAGEASFAASWMKDFAPRAPGLRLRRNYPYQGRSDGLMSLLRRRHPDVHYRGIELEVNQRFVMQGGAPWEALRAQLVASLVDSLATDY
jgi:predicted N-formylglutamate amidohydrolase